jgi:phosphatidylglycerophosphate synthase
MDELRDATRETDGPIARIDRAVSLRLSGWLVGTPLRPNHITMLGTCTGLLAAWALAQGTYWYGLLGAWLFWLAIIIDGCDGEVARLKFLESRFGQLFDVITDNLVHVAIFAGLGVGAYRAGRIEEAIAFTATLIAGFLCASAATYFCLLGDGPVKQLEARSRRGRMRRRVLQIFEALMNRDFAYLIAVLALIDRLHWFLWGTVFGTYAYALGLVWVYRLSDGSAPATPGTGEYAQLESRDAI